VRETHNVADCAGALGGRVQEPLEHSLGFGVPTPNDLELRAARTQPHVHHLCNATFS